VSAIVALVEPEASSRTTEWLAQATELSRCAGPDDQAHVQRGPCGLGHALLQTGRESLGPSTLDGRHWITADVRLDARSELAAKLRIDATATPRAPSDAELILHAYRAWGERLVEHLSGDFAFALWDAGARRLVCARDQLGVGILHYAQVGRSLAVASCLDALLAHPEVSDALDERAIVDFLAFGYPLDPDTTAFAAIRQLPPAHMLTWTDGEVRIRRYWKMGDLPPLTRLASVEEGAERMRELLDVVVADRLTAPKASTQLSGGLDSTNVAASAVRVLGDRGALRAFTGVLGGRTGDREGEFAALVADHLRLPLDLVDASAQDALDPLAEPRVRTPEPVRYDFTGHLTDYARVPARHAAVALTGQGGDALLGYAPWYWLEWLGQGQIRRLGQAVREQVRLTGQRPHPRLRLMAHGVASRHHLMAPMPRWLRADVVARAGVVERQREQAPWPFGKRARDLDARGLADDPQWAALFRVADPAFTRMPLRFRHPYFDLRLIEFVRSLPPEPWLIKKLIMREAARPALPQAVRERPKTPLVAVAPPGAQPAVLARLAEMVRRCPELDQFFDTHLLARSVTTSAGDADPRRTWMRDRALGLSHWLWHRSSAG
jgi:asparagine synthase (glutamine-hydrolysing)